MDKQKLMFLGFIVIAVALAIYGMVIGSWLTRKSIKLEDEAEAGGHKGCKGLKARAMEALTGIALIVFPVWGVCFGYGFDLGRARMEIVLMIALFPSVIYNFYYRFKAFKTGKK